MNVLNLIKKYKDILLYIIFGIATTVVNFTVYTIFVKFLSQDMTFSNFISWVVSVSFAFVTNKVFVFSSTSFKAKVLFKEMSTFFTSRIITGIIEIVFPTVLFDLGLNSELFGIKGFWAKAIVNVVIIILNYVFSKLFVFKKK